MTNRFRDQCPLDCKVYVGELGNSGTRHEIEEAFGYYGPLRNVWVARNPPGFAFVMFEDPRDARDAVRALDGKVICGRRIKCELSTGKSRREGSRGFPSREGGRGYPPSSRGRGGSPRNGDSHRDREYPSHRETSGYESGRDHHYRRYPEPRSRSRSFSPVNADHHHRGSSKYGSSSLHGPAGSNGNGLTKHVPHHSRTPPSRSRSRSPVSKSPRSEARYH